MQLSSLPELGFRKGQCFVATEVVNHCLLLLQEYGGWEF